MKIDDEILTCCDRPFVSKVWIPKDTCVVVGNGNDLEREVFTQKCAEDGVSVFRRSGGGGAVVLHPGCLIVGVGAWVEQIYQNQKYFSEINRAVIRALTEIAPDLSGLVEAGISDIALNDSGNFFKVAGTSLFRSRNYLLYQASILVDAKAELLAKYLQHPSREPDYRQGRAHKDFVRGLVEIDRSVDVVLTGEGIETYKRALDAAIYETLDLITPIAQQIPAIQARIGRK